jgi:hypothetical protein
VEINSHVTIEGVFDMVCTEELSWRQLRWPVQLSVELCMEGWEEMAL